MMKTETLNDIVGMADKKELARIQIISCVKRNKTFPHTLLYGIGGLGKTKLARAIANEIGYDICERQASAIKSIKEVHDLLTSVNTSLIFIDECHRLGEELQEELYAPMQEFKISTEQGLLNINPFTLFAATTRIDLLDTNSFISRFQNVWELSRYNQNDLAKIIVVFFRSENIEFDTEALKEIVQRSLGIPRTALNLAHKARDVALSYNSRKVTGKHALYAFRLEKIDCIGLNHIHHRYLNILSSSKKAIGVSSIAAMMRLTKKVVEGSVEPILFEMGLVKIGRGRALTENGRKFLGLK